MYAYCGNNPVLFEDSSGTRHEISAGGGGCFYNPGPNVSLWEIIEEEVMNDDPETALEGDGISFYKGVPVVKTPIPGKDAFSFGAIFVGADVESANLLRHEYGHALQLRELGVVGYAQYVVVPSVTCYLATEAGALSDDLYYNLPWENIADRYGEAKRTYISGASDLADTYWLLVKGLCKSGGLLW